MSKVLHSCPFCNSDDLEEDWDGLSEGSYDTQYGEIACGSCGFSVSKLFSTEFTPDNLFSEELYSMWNSLIIVN